MVTESAEILAKHSETCPQPAQKISASQVNWEELVSETQDRGRLFSPVRLDFDFVLTKRSGTKEPGTLILTSFRFCLLHFISALNSLCFILLK